MEHKSNKRKFVQGPMGAKRQRTVFKRKTLPAVLRTTKVEIKTCDVLPNGQDISTTPQYDLLNGIQSGPDFNQRIGRRIHMKSIAFRGQIRWVDKGASNTAAGDFLRIMVIYDRQPNNNLPVLSDIILSVDQIGNTSSSAYDGLNMNNSDRFLVLRDRIITTQTQQGGAATNSVEPMQASTASPSSKWEFNDFIKLKDLETKFSGTATPVTAAQITEGSLFLVCFGNKASAAANYNLAFQARLRYIDV